MRDLTIDLRKERPLSGILPKQLVYILRIYLTGLLFFTVFRTILLLQEFHQLHYLPTEKGAWLVIRAFLIGLRFDTVVSGYILTLPFLLLTVDALTGWDNKQLKRLVFALVSVGYVFSFFVCAADIPFFHHFYSRMSMSALISANKSSSGMLSGMIFQEWRFTWVLLPFFVISGLFIRTHRRYFNILFKREELSFATALRSFSFFALLLFMGIWGRISFQSHIDAGTAYFSDYAFTNMLGLNPAYTFGQSYVNSFDDAKLEVRFMGDGEAIRNVQDYLKTPAAQDFNSPIAREVLFADTVTNKPNVVIVIMESMSAYKMGRYGNPNHLTPFLDSLATQGYAFDSIFTSGIHTFAGTYSTLYAYPVIKMQHPMMTIAPHAGIAPTLQERGYATIYFTTHDKYFDNAGPFLLQNGFDRVVSKDDYPPERILSALGVPDDYLFEHAVGDLNKLHQQGKPFFATILTGSDHSPFIIPKYFKPKKGDVTQGVVEYADWSVRKFLNMASQSEWFDNTLFVFVADHGASIDKRYDMPISYLHSPLIFYSPSLLGAPRQFNNLGCQLDIFPTVMGLLKLPYVNNSLGIDLLRESRSFVCSYADDKFAVLDTEYMYVERDNGITSLYRYRSGDVRDYSKQLPGRVKSMKKFGESTFQAAQWLRKNGKVCMQVP